MECLRTSKTLRSGFETCELRDVALHLAKYAMLSTAITMLLASYSDFSPPTPMHFSFEALLVIFNARILRLDEFFPFDHSENSDIFFLHALPATNNLPY